jgi:hypothetical protein
LWKRKALPQGERRKINWPQIYAEKAQIKNIFTAEARRRGENQKNVIELILRAVEVLAFRKANQ